MYHCEMFFFRSQQGWRGNVDLILNWEHMWHGEQMPTETKAGKGLWKAGERAHSEVAWRQRIKAGTENSLQVERTATGLRKLKFLTQMKKHPEQLRNSYIGKVPLLFRKRAKFPHQSVQIRTEEIQLTSNFLSKFIHKYRGKRKSNINSSLLQTREENSHSL